MMIVAVAAIGVLLYTVFLFDFSHRGDWPAYLLVLVAESFIVLQALISLWTILSSGHDPRDYTFNQAQHTLYGDQGERTQAIGIGMRHAPMELNGFPVTVDVFVTTYGEALADIRKTVEAAVALDGAHSVYVLDDGKSAAVRDLARELGAEYVAREGNAHAKAGNVNHALSITDGDLFVILDADFVARRDFLYETVPFFADPTVAFVQTPQTYGNLRGLISRGAGYMQTVFYKFTQPGKNRFNAAFCVGTNVVFRRTAVMEIGGIWQESKSEDVWTSIKLHERGWRSVFIGTELAVGHTPETIEAYTKQQLRWATGGFEILLRANPMGRGRSLTLDQRLQYFGTATFYLVGIAPGLLLLVPPLQIYFGIAPISQDVPGLTWFLYYAGFYFMQIVVALFTIGSFRWETLLLATASFPIYTKAFANALLRRDQAWSVTGQKGARTSPFTFIGPQVLAFVFLLATSLVGLWQARLDRTFSLAVFWNILNTVVLGAFVVTALKEAREIARETRELRRLRRTGREPVGEHAEKVVTPVLPRPRETRSAVPVAPVRRPVAVLERPPQRVQDPRAAAPRVGGPRSNPSLPLPRTGSGPLPGLPVPPAVRGGPGVAAPPPVVGRGGREPATGPLPVARVPRRRRGTRGADLAAEVLGLPNGRRRR
jgi:cellulose synthase (UDP-forming)